MRLPVAVHAPPPRTCTHIMQSILKLEGWVALGRLHIDCASLSCHWCQHSPGLNEILMPTSVAQALRLAALALGAFAVLAAKPSTEMSAQQPKQAAAVGVNVGGVSTGCQKRMTAVCGDWEANKGVCAEPARGRGDGTGSAPCHGAHHWHH